LKIGIVGAGRMGLRHAQSILSFGAQVYAIHDICEETVNGFAKETGANVVTTTLKEFFDHDLDGVVIATPPDVRLEPIRMVCECSVYIMIEKSPATSI
jgi:predicted dehydrogenase